MHVRLCLQPSIRHLHGGWVKCDQGGDTRVIRSAALPSAKTTALTCLAPACTSRRLYPTGRDRPNMARLGGHSFACPSITSGSSNERQEESLWHRSGGPGSHQERLVAVAQCLHFFMFSRVNKPVNNSSFALLDNDSKYELPISPCTYCDTKTQGKS